MNTNKPQWSVRVATQQEVNDRILMQSKTLHDSIKRRTQIIDKQTTINFYDSIKVS